MTASRLAHLSTEAPESHTGFCGFRAGPKSDPPPPACLAGATWHGIVLTDDATGVLTLLSCCDDHKPAMALTADLIHEMASACGTGEATIWWDGPNRASGCRIDWDPGHLAIALRAPVSA
jgi:hypothetical protein